MTTRILITGGAGYIGSHTILTLLEGGHKVCVVDNFSNSTVQSLQRVESLAGYTFTTKKADIRNTDKLEAIFSAFMPEVVIHFAGLKAVGDSASQPLRYYDHNFSGTISLLKAMDAVRCRHIAFSSSATVYGDPQYLPFDEHHPCAPINPYGRTKYFIEKLLDDWCQAVPGTSAAILRYFNPVGAHDSGKIGEHSLGIPNNLMPLVSQVAVGRRDKINIYGNDYDTVDGTGMRDYIHVMDLANAHAKAMEYCQSHDGVEHFNIGTGNGATVLQVIKAFEKASGQPIPYEITGRRPGDIACSIANPKKANQTLDWHAQRNLEDMCSSAWRWQSENPNGYSG